MGDEKTQDEQLADLDKLEEAEAKAAADKAARARLERAALKAKYVAKLQGPEGEAFAIVETPGGFVVFRKPDAMAVKAFRKSEMNDADQEKLEKSCLEEPDVDRFTAILDEWYALLDECLGAVLSLAGAKLANRKKK